ncbi:MAG: hypothetical protein ACD_65C00154G0001 [uncultured bacterium]|nr:MAG: hypothetical protein ACD_65C00154G0001 [uncultured bacterium]
MRILKNIIGILWLTAVIYLYFLNHSYYGNGWSEIGKWLPLIIIVFGLVGGILIYKRKNKLEITFPKITAAGLILIMLIGNTTFLIRDVSFYHGEDLFYSPDEGGSIFEIDDPSTLSGNEELLFTHESSVAYTSKQLEWLPEYFHSRFETPTFTEIQLGLLTKSIGIILILGLFTIISIGFGLTVSRLKPSSDNILISLGIGLFAIALFSFILGALHALNFWTAWGLFAALTAIGIKQIRKILKGLLTFKYEFDPELSTANLVLIPALGMTIGANFMDNISIFPRGWDGLNQYMNTAKEIFEAGGLIQTGGNYYWELLMSLGFTMFNWTTIALNLASFFPAVLCFVILFFIIKKFTSGEKALITASTIYMIPLFIFHGSTDNKVDLANFAISMLAFLSVYLGIITDSKRERISYIAIGGLLCGFCLGIKITSIMLIFALLTVILYKTFKWLGATAGTLFATSVFFLSTTATFGSNINISPETSRTIGMILFSISAILLTSAAFKQKNRKEIITSIIFIAFVGLAFMPWMAKNYSENHILSAHKLLEGVIPGPQISNEYLENMYDLNCEETGTHEELDRYLGYGTVFTNYITMPWNLTMNNEGTNGTYIDISWLFLGILPAFILFIPFKKPDTKWCVMAVFGISYWLFWLLTSNGIIWYGLPGFLALAAWTGGLMRNYEKRNRDFGKYLTNVLIVIFLISTLVLRLSLTGKGSVLLYISGVMTEEDVQLSIYPNSGQMREVFEKDQDGQNDLIWKIGTTLNYLIPGSYSRTYNDQYLDDINCLYSERDPELLTERLKELGFGYIIFDYFTLNISPDPESTLSEKYEAIKDYIKNHTEIIVPDYYKGYIIAKIPGT